MSIGKREREGKKERNKERKKERKKNLRKNEKKSEKERERKTLKHIRIKDIKKREVNNQVTRAHNIVAVGWAGAYNLHPHPLPPYAHSQTQTKMHCTIAWNI